MAPEACFCEKCAGSISCGPGHHPEELSGCRPPLVSGFRTRAPQAAHREDSCDRLVRNMMGRCILVPGNAVTTGPTEYLLPPTIVSYFFPSRCSLVSEGSSRRIFPWELGGPGSAG